MGKGTKIRRYMQKNKPFGTSESKSGDAIEIVDRNQA